jgi:homoserine dehydrogenase
MKRVRIGLVGCGKVGTAFCRLLKEKGPLFEKRDGIQLELAAIGVKHPDKERAPCVDRSLIVEGWQKVTELNDIDVLVELIGGAGDAKDAVYDALGRGHHTVTANKVLLSTEGSGLTELAIEKKRGLCFEAAVGSGTPIIGAIADTLSANRFEKLIGIVNGTTNYILSRMTEDKLAYDKALNDAIDKGFCEADPSFDIDGKDAAQKLSILAALAFGVEIPPEEIYTEGISNVTRADIELVQGFGYVIKLLAIGKRTTNGVELRVHPALVSARHPLASVRDELNAFLLRGDVSGDVMVHGKGAGPESTAGAVLSDVARLSHFEETPWLSRRWNYENLEHLPIGDVETGYHLIFPVQNKPGIIGRITSTLGSYGINIDSAHAHLADDQAEQGLVQILSRSARERDVRAAIKAVQELPLLTGNVKFYRVAVLAER